MSEEDYLAAVAALQAEAALSPLGAGILAASRLGIVSESRAFARTFGIAHALVLRAVTELAGSGFIEIAARDSRTQRTTYVPNARGAELCARAGL